MIRKIELNAGSDDPSIAKDALFYDDTHEICIRSKSKAMVFVTAEDLEMILVKYREFKSHGLVTGSRREDREGIFTCGTCGNTAAACVCQPG